MVTTQSSDCLHEALLFQRRKELIEGPWVPFQCGSLFAQRGKNVGWSQIQLTRDEFVGMLSLDAIGLQDCGREVGQVVGDDRIHAATDGCSKDVSIVEVWQGETRNQRLMPGDQRIEDVSIHQLTGSLELGHRKIRAIASEVSKALIEDRLRPASAKEVHHRQPEQQVPQRCRIQNTCVVEDRIRSHGQYPRSSACA